MLPVFNAEKVGKGYSYGGSVLPGNLKLNRQVLLFLWHRVLVTGLPKVIVFQANHKLIRVLFKLLRQLIQREVILGFSKEN